jgi:hypothetical protein
MLNMGTDALQIIPIESFTVIAGSEIALPDRQLMLSGVVVEKVPQQNVFSSASMPLSAFFSPFD